MSARRITPKSTPQRTSDEVAEDCPWCSGSGYDEQSPDACCSHCDGTGDYSGIPDAWDKYGIDAVYLDTDSETTSVDPRGLVRLDTFTCQTALTLEGAEELISRLYRAVREIDRQAAESALANALASGERPLNSIRQELGPRAFNCLARQGVLTIEQAAAMTDEEMLCIVNLGVTTLERIRSVVGCSPR